MNLIFRPLSEDAQAVCDIIHACREADGIDPYSTLESLPTTNEVEVLLKTLPPENTIGAEMDGRLVGYNRITWWIERDGLWLYLHLGRVLPEFRGRGIGTTLLEWSEQRIRQLAVEQSSGEWVMFGANASSTEIDSTRLLLDNGYQAVFTLAQMAYTDLTALSLIPVPDGVEVRAALPEDTEAIWKAQRAAWAEKPGFGIPAPAEEEASVEELRENIARSGHLWKIAWVGGQVASQVWNSLHDIDGVKVGWMDEVNTTPEFRRRGLSQLAINHSLNMFCEMGASQARLHTDDGNSRGAKSLYEKIGFKTLKTFPRYRKALS